MRWGCLHISILGRGLAAPVLTGFSRFRDADTHQTRSRPPTYDNFETSRLADFVAFGKVHVRMVIG